MLRHFCASFFMACALLACQGEATELEPWHRQIYSVDFHGNCLLQGFRQLDTRYGAIRRPELDAFYNFSALGVCKDNSTAEIELLASNTRYRGIGLNAFRLTGRYFWLNDIVGDPVSLAVGFTASKIFRASRHNVAIFDHGGIACEAHVSVGKEVSCEQFWTSRGWAVVGVGIADVGSPWVRANLVWEKNWWNIHQLKVFADTIWGFGGNGLRVHHFDGYGSVNYQAVDVGFRYGFILPNNTFLGAGYAYRVYGRNCPIHVGLAKLEIIYPIQL
jgi:hypothetical protein